MTVGQVPASGTTEPAAPSSGESPKLKVEQVAGGLQHGWDIGFLPDGKVLVTQRPGKIALLSSAEPGATVTEVKADLSDVLVQGEGGLMGLVVHPDFVTVAPVHHLPDAHGERPADRHPARQLAPRRRRPDRRPARRTC